VTAAQPLHQLPDAITAELINAIAQATPRLPGPPCRAPANRAIFDRASAQAAGMGSARAQALAICDSCPALTLCRRWIEPLDENDRPRGIVGGMLVLSIDRAFPADAPAVVGDQISAAGRSGQRRGPAACARVENRVNLAGIYQ